MLLAVVNRAERLEGHLLEVRGAEHLLLFVRESGVETAAVALPFAYERPERAPFVSHRDPISVRARLRPALRQRERSNVEGPRRWPLAQRDRSSHNRCVFEKLRVAALSAMLSLAALAIASTPVAARGRNPYPHDAELSISDVQMLGTHNSYHTRPARELIANEPADYEHPPLDVQLADEGIRSVEVDAFNGPTLPVLQSLLLDESSTCPTLEGCLRTINTWSKANRGHVPLILFIEPDRKSTRLNSSHTR